MLHRGSGHIATLAVAALIGACSTSNTRQESTPLPEQVSGCYRLELWPGDSGPEVERRRAAWGTAPTVRLDTTRLTAWPSLLQQYGTVFVAYSITESGEVRDHPFNYWRFVAGDSLFVGHPRAMAGVSMMLHIEGQDLNGEITSFTDVRAEDRPSTTKGPVLARRVACP